MKSNILSIIALLFIATRLHAFSDDDLRSWQKKAAALQGVSLAEAKRIMAVYNPKADRVTFLGGTSFVDPDAVYYSKVAFLANSGPLVMSGDHAVIQYYVAPGIITTIDYQIAPPGSPVNHVSVERRPLSFRSDGVHRNFLEDGVNAVTCADTPVVFPLKGDKPSGVFDKKNKILNIAPVVSWLDSQKKDGKALSKEAYFSLKSIVLSPENYKDSLFCISEPTLLAISFKDEGETGYIVLGNSLVGVIWEGKQGFCLLNDSGHAALRQWIKQNGYGYLLMEGI